MDKNIAALLREDTRTVHVTFDIALNDFDDLSDCRDIKVAGSPWKSTPKGPRLYTYVTHLDLQPKDVVVVTAAGDVKLAAVVRVDATAEIEPNADVAYQWVIDKVHFDAYEANKSRNAEIERTVGAAYRSNLRRGFAQMVLDGVPDAQKGALQALIKGKAA